MKSKLQTLEERARIARVFGRGLGKATGFVLPRAALDSRAGKGG